MQIEQIGITKVDGVDFSYVYIDNSDSQAKPVPARYRLPYTIDTTDKPCSNSNAVKSDVTRATKCPMPCAVSRVAPAYSATDKPKFLLTPVYWQ